MNAIDEGTPPVKETVGIEAVRAVALQDLFGWAEAIGACDFAFLLVPNPQMQIIIIERVQVEGLSRALASGAERLLTKPADFVENIRNLLGAGEEDREIVGFDQGAARLQFR